MREHTPPNAVVQVDTEARGDAMWAYLPAFAERRMAAGLPISMVPLRKHRAGAHWIHWLFDVDRVESAYELAERFKIDYLVVGPPERRAHPGLEQRWTGAPTLLAPAFHNDTLTIYEVRHHRL